jgi:hypothetical protein
MPDRHCGDCTLCCRLLPVRELAKPANTRCQHQGNKGCAIYHRAGFPISCAVWSCRWLTGHDTADMQRPDRSGWVIDVMPDIVRQHNNETGEVEIIPVVQIWVRAGCEPLKDRRLLRYAERQAEQGVATLLRFDSTRAVALFAPPLTGGKGWRVVSGDRTTVVQSATGNLLLDMLAEEASKCLSL